MCKRLLNFFNDSESARVVQKWRFWDEKSFLFPLDKILMMVEKTGVNPAWLLLGVGEPEGDQNVMRAFNAVVEDDLQLRDLSRSGIPLDERTEFVARQLELLIKMLRSPEEPDGES